MSDLAYPAPQLVTALLTLLQKVSPPVTQTHPVAVGFFNDSRETQLPDKKMLQAKLHEFYLANEGKGDAE
jgi:hypothetical protein